MYICNKIQFKKHAFTSHYIKSALFLWKVYKYIDNRNKSKGTIKTQKESYSVNYNSKYRLSD